MPDEVNEGTAPEAVATDPAVAEAPPTDFREFVKWRATGELPEPKAAAAVEEPPATTEPESAPDSTQETEDEEETAEAGESPPKRPGSRQRKIDKLTRDNEELRRQLEARTATPAEPAKPAQPEGKPKLENFDTLEDHVEAIADWKIEQREKKRAEAEAQQKAQEAHDRLQADWSKRAKAAAKAHDDFQEVTDSVQAPDAPGVRAARQAMLEDEAGAEILYHLGKHPEELKRIAGLSPVSAIREIGKLSALLTKASVPENGKPRVSSAPKPPPALTRPAKTSSDDPTDPNVALDWRRWSKAREAQLKDR